MTPQVTMLMCSERSGSNLISRMMGAHPDICSPSPSHLMRILAENRGRYGDLQQDHNWRHLLGDTIALLDTQLGTWQRTWTAESLGQDVSERSLSALLRHLFFAEATASDCGRLFIKENHIYHYLPFLQRAFPGLQVVYLVRDPRDMALSWKKSSILRGDVVRAARIWAEDQRRGRQVMGYLAGGADLHQTRYEDLVANSAGALGHICEFLGLEPHEAMINFHRQDDAIAASGRTGDWKNLDQPVMKANFGKYRTGLNETEIACVEALCGPSMDVFGYDREMGEELCAADLENRLLPLERHDKPGWAEVPEAEQTMRRARADVRAAIESRPWQLPTAARVQHA